MSIPQQTIDKLINLTKKYSNIPTKSLPTLPTKTATQIFNILETISQQYYESNSSPFTDEEYDILADLTEKSLNKRPFSSTPIPSKSNSTSTDFGLVDYQHWFTNLLGTLSKLNTYQEFFEATKNPSASMNLQFPFAISPKVDGNSIAFTLDLQSQLTTSYITEATTRGKDGQGKNISYIFTNSSITQHIYHPTTKEPLRGKFAVKCEAAITWESLEKYNANNPSKTYKSPRSFITAILSSSDFTGFLPYMSLVLLDLVSDDAQITNSLQKISQESHLPIKYDILTDIANSISVPFSLDPITNYITYHKSLRTINQLYQEYSAQKRYSHKYQLDGLVIESLSSPRTWNKNSPTYATALKFPYAEKRTKITSLRIDQGAVAGRITPVVQFEPVIINNHEYTNVSLSSYARWKELQPIGIGSEVIFQLRNDTLGYIIKAPNSEKNMTQQLYLPDNCPTCDSQLVLSNKEGLLYCQNPICDANIVGKGASFLKTIGVKGTNENTIEKLYNHNLYHNYTSIIKWISNPQAFIDQASSIERFGNKSATKLIQNIKSTITNNIQDAKLLSAFNIQGLGEEYFTNYFRVFTIQQTLEFLSSNSYQEIQDTPIPNWGDISKEKLITNFTQYNKIYYVVIKALLKYITPTPQLSQGFTPLKLAITGSCINPQKYNRKLLTDILKKKGHKVTGSVSSKTDYLITDDNDSSSSKYQTALQNNVPIISSEEAVIKFIETN